MNSALTFRRFTDKTLLLYTGIREGEEKIGQRITTEITEKTKYVLFGIEESHGPQANKGFPGTENAFPAFIQRFLSMQSNPYLDAETCCVIGSIQVETDDQTVLRIEELDLFVTKTILNELKNKAITPIFIGGGHNNAYPIIKAITQLHQKSLQIINLDPHADCRSTDIRHSGNPFSFAIEEQLIHGYSILALHKAYNNLSIYNFLEKHKIEHTFFEDYLYGHRNLQEDIRSIVIKFKDELCGIELDLDSIGGMPASAFTPCGVTINEARFYIRHLSKNLNCSYFHFAEGAPTSEQEEKIVGKTLAYLVFDIVSN